MPVVVLSVFPDKFAKVGGILQSSIVAGDPTESRDEGKVMYAITPMSTRLNKSASSPSPLTEAAAAGLLYNSG